MIELGWMEVEARLRALGPDWCVFLCLPLWANDCDLVAGVGGEVGGTPHFG